MDITHIRMKVQLEEKWSTMQPIVMGACGLRKCFCVKLVRKFIYLRRLYSTVLSRLYSIDVLSRLYSTNRRNADALSKL